MRIVAQEKEKNATRITTTGQQIKDFAGFMRGMGMFASIVCGILLFKANPILAIIVIAGGCNTAWASTVLLMGFGELIDETTANRANTDRILFALESIQKTLQDELTDKQKEPEA